MCCPWGWYLSNRQGFIEQGETCLYKCSLMTFIYAEMNVYIFCVQFFFFFVYTFSHKHFFTAKQRRHRDKMMSGSIAGLLDWGWVSAETIWPRCAELPQVTEISPIVKRNLVQNHWGLQYIRNVTFGVVWKDKSGANQ